MLYKLKRFKQKGRDLLIAYCVTVLRSRFIEVTDVLVSSKCQINKKIRYLVNKKDCYEQELLEPHANKFYIQTVISSKILTYICRLKLVSTDHRSSLQTIH